MIAASQAEGFRPSLRAGRRRLLRSTTQADSVTGAGGGAARHTRAESVGAPTVVAGCRRLRFVALPCQMQESATVNGGVSRLSSRQPDQVSKLQVSGTIPPPLS